MDDPALPELDDADDDDEPDLSEDEGTDDEDEEGEEGEEEAMDDDAMCDMEEHVMKETQKLVSSPAEKKACASPVQPKVLFQSDDAELANEPAAAVTAAQDCVPQSLLCVLIC